jgi:hypothetical protein
MASEFAEGFNTGVDRIMRFYGDPYVDIDLRNPVQNRLGRAAGHMGRITHSSGPKTPAVSRHDR